jgi:hypothetical protein
VISVAHVTEGTGSNAGHSCVRAPWLTILVGGRRHHRCGTMARQLELPEFVTAGKFLILTGIILPLLAGPRGHKLAMP